MPQRNHTRVIPQKQTVVTSYVAVSPGPRLCNSFGHVLIRVREASAAAAAVPQILAHDWAHDSALLYDRGARSCKQCVGLFCMLSQLLFTLPGRTNNSNSI